MGLRAWGVGAAVLCVTAGAARVTAQSSDEPTSMRLIDERDTNDAPRLLVQAYDYESVYAPPDPISANTGVNEGGVHVELDISYLTDYVFRGIDQSERIASFDPDPGAPGRPEASSGKEDSPNIQVDGRLTWDLDNAPDPFIGVFVNTFDADPESRFQEIRPFVGFDWTIRPINLVVGHNTFVYPDRDVFNTAEVFAKITVDDSYFTRTDDPILSPYVFAAYDYDLYDALYLEAGVEHQMILEGTGIVLTARASVAYVDGHALFLTPGSEDDSGFQHYQLGLIGSYRLNPLLNIPMRYGNWTFKGYLFYTDGIENDLAADTQVWGGAGIGFSY